MTSLRPAKNLETHAESDLLERARLTLEVLEYREQAARYKAAAASLKAAMTAAKHGDLAPLQKWISGQKDSLGDATTLPEELRRQLAEFADLDLPHGDSTTSTTRRIDTGRPVDADESVELPTTNSRASLAAVRGGEAQEADVDSSGSQGRIVGNASGSDSANTTDSSDQSGSSYDTVSPWDLMIQGARTRGVVDLADDAASRNPVTNDVISQGAAEEPSSSFDSSVLGRNKAASSKIRGQDLLHAGNANAGDGSPDPPSDQVDRDSDEVDRYQTVEAPLLSDEIVTALEQVSAEPRERSLRAMLLAPHMWISFVVHAVMIAVMSAFIIATVQKTELMSIVAATVEADNVLMETPMEMPSELEQPMEEMTAPLSPAQEISAISVDNSLPSIPAESTVGQSIAQVPSQASLVSDATGMTAMSGSKMVSGAEFFGVKATGNTFIYVVDSSPSMRRDGAFEAAKEEVLRSLGSMKPKQRYFINFFGKEIDPLTFQSGVVEKYPVYATSENLRKTMEWLSRIQIQKEGLPPNDALREAIAMQPDGIFLLFDGDTKVDVAAFLRKANRSNDIIAGDTPKVPIHVVHFFQSEYQKAMMKVAEENGGTYRFIPRPEKPMRTKK